jgi:hypothetical protein
MTKAPSATQAQLEKSEREDAGRGLEWVWLQAEGGGAYASANGLSDDKLLGTGTKADGGAGLIGVAAGARLLFFTVGVRARMSFLADYRIVSVMPEVGAHVPLGRWEPYFFLGAGYATLSGLPKIGTERPSIAGFDGRVGLGIDHYLTPTFSVGGLVTSDFLFLGRSAIAGQPSGSGTGIAVAGSAVLGLHFLRAARASSDHAPLALTVKVWLSVALFVFAALVPAIAAVRLVRTRGPLAVSTKRLWLTAISAAAAAIPVLVVSRSVMRLLGHVPGTSAGDGTSLFLALAFVAPLHEAAKVMAAWPAYHRARNTAVFTAVLLAMTAAAGFAVGETATLLVLSPSPTWRRLVRTLLELPAQMGFAGIWGYALGRAPMLPSPIRRFVFAFLSAVLLHGVFRHLVWMPGVIGIAGAIPLLLGLFAFAWITLRDLEGRDDEPLSHVASSRTPTLQSVRDVFSRRSARRVSPGWVALGAFVTQGTVFAMLALAVLIGRRSGIVFATLEDPETAGVAPVAILAGATLAAFPIAGWLLARARTNESALEAGLSSAVAVAATTVVLGMSAPSAVAFALASAPVAVALACMGAWAGGK